MKTKFLPILAAGLMLLSACKAGSPGTTGKAGTVTLVAPAIAGTSPTLTSPAITYEAIPPEPTKSTPVETVTPQVKTATQTPLPSLDLITQVVNGLDTPWDIVFLPGSGILVTERSGILALIDKEGKQITISGVREIGEGGLLGLTLHPAFARNRWLYIYLTSNDTGKLTNRVERYTYNTDHTVSERVVILDGIKGSSNHDGGRIRFGPDGLLYITTGDAGDPQRAQNLSALEGKILRVTDEGKIPVDNPWGNPIYSIGHRNPQGLAWDSQGRLWETEHGPSGTETGNDELNLIEPGKNYGWPIIRGMETRAGMETPKLESGKGNTWAPAGLEIVDDIAYFPGLRGTALYAIKLSDIKPDNLLMYFEGEYGRLRAIRLGPDGLLYLGTSNKDGRGSPSAEDDQLLKIDLSQLKMRNY
jgi:glucose/arabinose dehydrogenase